MSCKKFKNEKGYELNYKRKTFVLKVFDLIKKIKSDLSRKN